MRSLNPLFSRLFHRKDYCVICGRHVNVDTFGICKDCGYPMFVD